MKNLIYTLVLLLSFNLSYTQQPAFPGAEGYGKYSIGGRAGTVYKVTNLNDSGPGSLREACEASGPRTIVFELGGRIDVLSTINITDPYITIAGQTAPGDGISIGANSNYNFSVMTINTHDVIIRHLRFRREENDPGAETNDDNLSIAPNSNNVIIDHCSFSQSADEALSMFDYNNNGVADVNNVTIQKCIIGRAYGGGSKGQIAAGGLDKISWYKNYWASNFQRNVLLKVDEGTGSIEDTYFEFVNNVIYNAKFKTSFSDNDSQSGLRHLNYINNIYIENGADQRRMLMIETQYPVRVYAKGNISPTRPSITDPTNVDWDEEWNITQADDFIGGVTDLPSTGNPNSYPLADQSQQVTTPFNTPIVQENITLLDAVDLWENIKNDVGATLPVRDLYDTARVLEVDNLNTTYGATSEPFQTYNSGTPPIDDDNDGMPDVWEVENFGTTSRDGTQDFDGDGYTDLEQYLNNIEYPTLSTPSPQPEDISLIGRNYKMYNLLGQLIKEGKFKENTWKLLEEQCNGFYIIQIKNFNSIKKIF